jgi:protein tyrosine/serine phosphatase
MLRQVALPKLPGQLWLHSMPGRREDLDEARRWIEEQNVARILSLAPLGEIRKKSSKYGEAIDQGSMRVEIFPVEDFGVPEDREKFMERATSVAHDLRGGRNVLVHCGAGIGRTGTFACCVLLALGRSLEQAQRDVAAAGSGAETDEQKQLLRWYAARESGHHGG